MDTMICQLPGGYVDTKGALHQEVRLTPLGGREEELLAGRNGESVEALVTLILSRCIHRIGTIKDVSCEITRSLLVGDRHYLLLKLREATFGEQVQTTILCPFPECGKKIDIDFSTKDIPIRASHDKGPTYRMELSRKAAFIDDKGDSYRDITFRLPNGGDQELISHLITDDKAAVLAVLLNRCIKSIGPFQNPDKEMITRLSTSARLEIEKQIESCAPYIDLLIESVCPECGRQFSLPFDLQSFFFGELRISRDLLYREVHYLAYHYHWSEKEILEMSRVKRRTYIEVLADEIEKMNNASDTYMDSPSFSPYPGSGNFHGNNCKESITEEKGYELPDQRMREPMKVPKTLHTFENVPSHNHTSMSDIVPQSEAPPLSRYKNPLTAQMLAPLKESTKHETTMIHHDHNHEVVTENTKQPETSMEILEGPPVKVPGISEHAISFPALSHTSPLEKKPMSHSERNNKALLETVHASPHKMKREKQTTRKGQSPINDVATQREPVRHSFPYRAPSGMNPHTDHNSAQHFTKESAQIRQGTSTMASKALSQKSQTSSSIPPHSQPVVIIKRPLAKNRAPSAFWERSYLGRFHLRTVR